MMKTKWYLGLFVGLPVSWFLAQNALLHANADDTPKSAQRRLWHGAPELARAASDERKGPRPRVARLEFSPAWEIDHHSICWVRILDDRGQPLQADEPGSELTRIIPAHRLQHPMALLPGERGVIAYSAALRAQNAAPSEVTVELRYTGGSWRVGRVLPPDLPKTLRLDETTSVERVGETPEGQALVVLKRRDETKMGTPFQFDVVAVTHDGRLLTHRRDNASNSERLGLVEQFEFEVPLAAVKVFRIRDRPLRKVTYQHVVLGVERQASLVVEVEPVRTGPRDFFEPGAEYLGYIEDAFAWVATKDQQSLSEFVMAINDDLDQMYAKRGTLWLAAERQAPQSDTYEVIGSRQLSKVLRGHEAPDPRLKGVLEPIDHDLRLKRGDRVKLFWKPVSGAGQSRATSHGRGEMLDSLLTCRNLADDGQVLVLPRRSQP